ncbi:MAG: crossover junction endodeoxyribonuclease RuvC [Burkholderiaceae bacterium]
MLGIDPGLRRTGFGVIQSRNGRCAYLGSGVIRTGQASVAERLGIIYQGITEIIGQYHPTESAIEKVFVNVNPQTTLLLGQARGAAMTALVMGQLPVHEYTALQLKKTVTGHGHADKRQVQAMVKRLLALPAEPSEDAADALACALCHVNHSALTGRLRAVRATRLTRVRAGRLV